jgi:hypothetical protein
MRPVQFLVCFGASEAENATKEAAMENAREFRQRAEEHRAAARTADDLWESVIRFHLAARYEELAARREKREAREALQPKRAG